MYWDRVAKLYDLFEGISNRKVYEETGRRVAEEIEPVDEVLECACGTGAISKYVAPRCRSLTATDFSRSMLRQTEKKLREYTNVSVAFADITNLNYSDESFDKVIAGNVIHLMEQPYAVINELLRVCKTGGKVIGPTYSNMAGGKRRFIVRLLERSGAGFKRQFDRQSYIDFFEGGGYTNISLAIVEGRMPCAIAILNK